jgi:hypothetical protein
MMAVTAEPLRETAQRALIEAHIAEGDWAEGHRSFETNRNLLDRELGVQPDPELASMVYGSGWPSEFAALAASSSIVRHYHSGSVGEHSGLGHHRNKAPSWNGSNGVCSLSAKIERLPPRCTKVPTEPKAVLRRGLWLSEKK